MPPKKKCTHKARKAELIFLEKPWAGPIHCYEAPPHLAENPRRVPTKPVDLNTSSAWVCPQFDTSKPVVLKARQKKHHGPQKPYNQDANHSSFHAGGACQGAVACRFPPLTFENSEGHAVPPLDDPNCLRKNAQCSPNHPKKGTAANANIQVKGPENYGEPASQPVEQEVPSPSDAEAAKVPSPRNGRCSNTLSQSSHAWHPEEELPLGIDPCGRGGEAAVLVADTPEHEYGVKVTWRRRPHIMRYLREQGKLSAADILVKANIELSRRQAHT
ncbi:RAD9, HUS1, RAD1-interacting nuclear orphan protein 1 [Motacilla alba alba]|uniref:RAD9, HUS1, RAD1-interacting nuclear orphan protein 1 n=1 Tax=Motacilla alba alba TaxID=1094192 RepID=UPI0018D53303|nr:RAD9, HUS1, RAD1-interacting nuclear orphan protein 1 [Motacilla alba alba]